MYLMEYLDGDTSTYNLYNEAAINSVLLQFLIYITKHLTIIQNKREYNLYSSVVKTHVHGLELYY